ncbi:hypothetical protein EVAR_35441_1 [Eumeta japonica]|uniref:Uncharacterized protein n=1 Tax=Eumeta variegata TaxID=151549 RepID=A0A4C1X9C6_EUMVA|nr:hypothetical protein EVAR_35441_1 [Eumeta japonica]
MQEAANALVSSLGMLKGGKYYGRKNESARLKIIGLGVEPSPGRKTYITKDRLTFIECLIKSELRPVQTKITFRTFLISFSAAIAADGRAEQTAAAGGRGGRADHPAARLKALCLNEKLLGSYQVTCGLIVEALT